MTSPSNVRAAVEAYLLESMGRLCGDTMSDVDTVRDSCRFVEELGLFNVDTRFESIANALGPARTTSPHIIEDAPEALRASVEHRYSFSRWPEFEFRILESRDGFAWGQAFVRQLRVVPPQLADFRDLHRWSHVESEVAAAFGGPAAWEEWWPWKTVQYQRGATEYTLCYVFNLLQRIDTSPYVS